MFLFYFSICSGLVAATLGTPADVIKTRIMNNPDLYRGTIDCFNKSVSFVPVSTCFVSSFLMPAICCIASSLFEDALILRDLAQAKVHKMLLRFWQYLVLF